MKTVVRSLIGAALVMAAACGQGRDAQAQNNRAQARVQQQLGPVPTVVDTSLAAKLSGTFRAAAARALPAVVYVRVASRPVAMRHPDVPGFPPGFFGAPERRGTEVATGSGFIYDRNGLILTNNHVVADADEVLVRLVDGREYHARVVGRDPYTDVAVIRITPRAGEPPLPTVQMGNSDRVQVGDWVVALGNPLGLDFTVTAGIISAKGRYIGILTDRQGNQALEAYIQTDAAINPGNSGGPLVDLLGRVVAINSAIESPTGTFVGAGFAIPINLAMRVAQDLVRYGAVHRPRLGIGVRDVTEADAEVNGLPSIAGALVATVQPGTPAASAGLEPGDVVVSVNGKPIRTGTDLTTSLAELQPGDVVTLTVYRKGQHRNVRVKLGQFVTERATTTPSPSRTGSEQRFGLNIAPLTPELSRRLHIDRTSGVVVTRVSQLSPAAGVVGRGYIILAINGQPVNTVADVERIAAKLRPGQVVSMRLFDPDPEAGGETVGNFRVP